MSATVLPLVTLGSACGLGVAFLARGYVPALRWWLVASMALATAGLFAVVGWRFGPTWELPAYLYFAALSVLLTVIDLATKRLPNVFTYPAYPVLLVLLAVPALVSGTWSPYLRAIVGGIVVLVSFALLHVIYPAGMGLGDVKLAGLVGLVTGWVSWTSPLWSICVGFLATAAVSIVLLATKRTTRHAEIAFGPFMLLGVWTVLVASGQTAA